jgi:hypothetical protein
VGPQLLNTRWGILKWKMCDQSPLLDTFGRIEIGGHGVSRKNEMKTDRTMQVSEARESPSYWCNPPMLVRLYRKDLDLSNVFR